METVTATKFTTKSGAGTNTAAAVYAAASARWAPSHCTKKHIIEHEFYDVTEGGNDFEGAK